MKKCSELGEEVKKIVEGGSLVPDEIVTKMVGIKLNDKSLLEKGFMLDGFPRTTSQAQDLNKILENINQSIDFALYMETSIDMIVRRLTGRRICKKCNAVFHKTNRPPKLEGICDTCSGELYQRADDNEETIKTRMDVYLKNTEPIIDFYEADEKLKKVDGNKESEDLEKEIFEIVNENRA